MLVIQHLSYIHPDKTLLFEKISFNIHDRQKVALTGNNGTGKSTLLQIIAGILRPASGNITINSSPYYIPQIFGQFNHLTVAEALGVHGKIQALHAILNGATAEENFIRLQDDWTIEDRCREALQRWQLADIGLNDPMGCLSGGQKVKVFLAGIIIHRPSFILMDEPTNHLDTESRQQLYHFIENTTATLLIVSHDRQLLHLLPTIYELGKNGIKIYGGNYEFYATQKQLEQTALHQDVKAAEKALRKAKEKERETMERQQKQDARGPKKQDQAGVARIMMNTLRNNAEKSTAKTQDIHREKITGLAGELQDLRAAVPDIDKMKFGFESARLHEGKVLFRAENLNYSYNDAMLWPSPLNFEICSGERIALKGANGSGKTTLIRILLGQYTPSQGNIYRAGNHPVYIDQDYSFIQNELSIYEQAQQYNQAAIEEHEIKIRLNRFLFGKDSWEKKCSTLSGGEKMRLALCCLTISTQAPDMIIMDEPTNNLDIQNIEMLTTAINKYRGTLIIVSHDTFFLKQTGIEREISL